MKTVVIDNSVTVKWINQIDEKVMKSGYKKGLKIILLTDDQYLLVDEKRYTIESI